MKEYTIFLSSENGVGATHDKTYLFDWSILPEGEYEMTFSFISSTKKVLEAEAESGLTALLVEAVIPFSSERYAVKSNGYANTSNIIGFIKPEGVDGVWIDPTTDFSTRQWASVVDNPSIRLYGKPQGNDFKIRLLSHTELLAIYSPNAYNMIMKLKHIC